MAGTQWLGGPAGSRFATIEYQAIPVRAPLQPLCDARHRRRRGARSRRHFVVRQPLIQQPRRLPTVRQRLQGSASVQRSRKKPLRLVDVRRLRIASNRSVVSFVRHSCGSSLIRRKLSAAASAGRGRWYRANIASSTVPRRARGRSPGIGCRMRLRQGDYERVTNRRADRGSRLVESYRDAGADLIHLVDLDGARDGTIRPDVVRRTALVTAPARVPASGGIRSVAERRAAPGCGRCARRGGDRRICRRRRARTLRAEAR